PGRQQRPGGGGGVDQRPGIRDDLSLSSGGQQQRRHDQWQRSHVYNGGQRPNRNYPAGFDSDQQLRDPERLGQSQRRNHDRVFPIRIDDQLWQLLRHQFPGRQQRPGGG